MLAWARFCFFRQVVVSYRESGLTIDLSGQTFTSDCEKWQYSIKTVNSVSVRANQTATITRLGAPIRNFQCISRFFVTFQCESVIVILLSYQSSCSLIHTLLAAIIYCCFVNYSILHQVKRPEQSIAGHFECAHCSPGSLWRWASWLVPFVCQLPWTKLSDH